MQEVLIGFFGLYMMTTEAPSTEPGEKLLSPYLTAATFHLMSASSSNIRVPTGVVIHFVLIPYFRLVTGKKLGNEWASVKLTERENPVKWLVYRLTGG